MPQYCKSSIVFCIIILCILSDARSQKLESLDKGYPAEFKEYMVKTNRSLIQLLRIYNPQQVQEDDFISNRVKISLGDCHVFKSISPLEESTYAIDPNTIFYIIDNSGDFVKLKDVDIEVWVHKNCIKHDGSRGIKELFGSNFKSEDFKKRLAKLTYTNLEVVRKNYNAFLKKNNKALFEKGKIKQHYLSQYLYVNEKIHYCESIYKEISRETKLSDNSKPALKNLRIRGHAFFGESSYKTVSSSEPGKKTSNKNIDLLVNGSYFIDDVSSVDFFLGNRTQTLLTSFSEMRYGGGYKREIFNHVFRGNIEFNNFRDKGNANLNYNKSNINLNILSSQDSYFQYRFSVKKLDQNYIEKESNTFSSLNVYANSSYSLNYDSKIEGSFNYIKNTSDQAFLNYNMLRPSLYFSSNSIKAKFIVEQRNYILDDSLDNKRYHLNFRHSAGNKNSFFDATYRNFASEQRYDFAEFGWRSLLRNTDSFRNFKAIELRTRFFPDRINLSYTDLRLQSRKGSKFSYFYDQNIRIFYPDSISNVIDIDGVLGVEYNLKYLSLGPVFKWHLSIDPKAEKLFDPLYNTYQIGLSLASQFTVMEKLSVNFRYIHDFSLVHYKQTKSFQEDELIVRSRVPINYQAYINISYRINKVYTLSCSYQRFDHTANFNLNGIQDYTISNQKNDLQVGIKVNPF